MEELKKDVKADHDRLVRVETKMDSMCKTLTQFIKESKEADKELSEKMDRINTKAIDDCGACKIGINKELQHISEKKLDSHWFKWIIGGLVSLTMIFVGSIVYNAQQVTANSVKIDHIVNVIERHVDWGDNEHKILNDKYDKIDKEYHEILDKLEE